MRRRFNTTGCCSPKRHYMVRLDGRLKKIKEDYVDEGSYFIINRGRQYGKTTTLRALEEYLKEDYLVLSLDFQEIGTEDFADASVFVRAFGQAVMEAFAIMGISHKEEFLKPLANLAGKREERSLAELFFCLSRMCAMAPKPMVMMIDEVDSASNNQVFIDFLAQLRGYYLKRDKAPIFHSVILAGVYNIKNLKLKLRPESERQYNSPWNTHESNEPRESWLSFGDCPWDQMALAPFDNATDFKIDMNFSVNQIANMLEEYETDYHMGIDIQAVAKEIYAYTSGYPVLVSSICKHIDEDILDDEGGKPEEAWSKEGVEKAVKMILTDHTPLFESMIRHLDEYPLMKQMFQAILFEGSEQAFPAILKAHYQRRGELLC